MTFIEFEFFEYTYEANAVDIIDYSYAPVYAYDSHNAEVDLCERIYLTNDEYEFAMCCTPDDRADMQDGCQMAVDSNLYDESNMPNLCAELSDWDCAGVMSTEVADYYLLYDACDYSYNCAESKFYEVAYVDTTPPVISGCSSGVWEEDIEKCTYWDFPSIAASDMVSLNVDVTDSITYGGTVYSGTYNSGAERLTSPFSQQYCIGGVETDEVDVDEPGTYCVIFAATDEAGNDAFNEVYVVNVADTIPPTIDFAVTDQTVECATLDCPPDYGEYSGNEPCSDEPEIVTSDNVDLDSVGDYTLEYACSDGYNSAVEYTYLTVEDTTDPTITCPCDIEVHVLTGEYYGEATVDDTCSAVTVSDNREVVNMNAIGTYVVDFEAVDAHGNSASCSQIVDVVDETEPTINCDPEYVQIEACTGEYVELSCEAEDDYDGSIQSKVEITGTVDVWTVGTYTIAYDVCDQSNNCADTAYRYVYVVDTTPPVVTLKGDEVTVFEASDRASASDVDVGASCTDTCTVITAMDPKARAGVGDGAQSPDDSDLNQYVVFALETKDWGYVEGNGASLGLDSLRDGGASFVDEQQYYCGYDIGEMDIAAAEALGAQPAGGSKEQFVYLEILADACGVYEATYTCTDMVGNTATATQYIVTMDTTPPVIYYGSLSFFGANLSPTAVVGGLVALVVTVGAVGVMGKQRRRRAGYKAVEEADV